MTVTKGKRPPKELRTHPNADARLIRTGRAARYPAPDGTLTFDKLSSVFASGKCSTVTASPVTGAPVH